MDNCDVIKHFKADKAGCISVINNVMKSQNLDLPSDKAIRNAVLKCVKTNSTYLKNKNRKGNTELHAAFLAGKFKFPTPCVTPRKCISKDRAAALDLKDDTLVSVIESLGQDIKQKEEEIAMLKIELESSNKQCDIGAKALKSASTVNRHLHKKVLKQTTKVSKLCKELTNVKRVLRSNTKHISRYVNTCTARGKLLKNANQRDIYNKLQISKLRAKLLVSQLEISQLTDDLNATAIEISSLKNRLAELETENQCMQDIAEETECNVIVTSLNNKFTAELQMCVYDLLKHNVTTREVAPVIKSVLQLAGKEASHLPCKSTVNNMNIQKLFLSQSQLLDVLPNEEHTTLYTDETTKFGDKYSGYHVSDSEGRMYVLGLRDIATKSAADTLSVFQEILSDVNARAADSDSVLYKKIVTNISATMSDRAATEMKLNKLLQEYKDSLLPFVHEDWEQLGKEEQEDLSRISNFFCGLHTLVHFAETASTALLESENVMLDDPPIIERSFKRPSEPGTARLIRTACKAMARGGDEKSGCQATFRVFTRSFLDENNLRTVPLEPFRGNRFNILFQNAAGVYFLHAKMIELLESMESNRLLASVLHDLKIPEYVAGCKALGLICRFVTMPLWSLIQDKGIHILDMNTRYNDLVTFLKDAAKNTEAFLDGNLLPFGKDTVVHKDAIFDALLKPWQHDDLVIAMLQIILPSMSVLAERLFGEYLPGGCFTNASPTLRTQTVGTHKHNVFAESIFGDLDRLLKTKPNITTVCAEAMITFCHNKTLEWLFSKTTGEKEKLCTNARQAVRDIRATFKQRQTQIRIVRLHCIEEKQRKREEKEIRNIQKKEGITSEIIHFGLWQTTSQIDAAIAGLPSKTSKLSALKAQLRFRQHVLAQKSDTNTIYAFSKIISGKRQDLSVEEMTKNLKTLINKLPLALPDGERNHLVGQRISHKFSTQSGETWWSGRVVSQVMAVNNLSSLCWHHCLLFCSVLSWCLFNLYSLFNIYVNK